MSKKFQILSILFLGFSSVAFSQIKEEKLILDRKREPEIKKIEKKKTSVPTVKNYPPKEKKTQDSLNLKYDITDVPAVSDFKTSNIQGEDISPKFENAYQDNYLSVGVGNYGKILGDANISAKLENNMEVGLDLHALSTSGLKKDYDWDSKASNFNAGLFLNNYGEKGKFNLNAEYGLSEFNYYGIYAIPANSDVDLQQRTNQFKVNGYYNFYSNEILNDVSVKSSFLKDHFDANENQVSILANFSKHRVAISDFLLNADLGIALETLKTDFSKLNKNSNTFLNLDLSPKITISSGNSYLMLGSSFNFLNSQNFNDLMTEKEKNNKAYWFPKAELQIAVADEFKFFGGVDGGLKLNSYANLLQENPFLVSDQLLKPTETKYHFYVGVRGDFDEMIKYSFSAGYSKINNIQFFASNSLFNYLVDSPRVGYDYANTFSAIYDNGTLSEVKGSVQFFPLENLVLDAELNFQKYKLDNYENIYNVPLLKAEIGAKYSLFEKKLLLGFKGYFVTDRTTNSFQLNENIITSSYESTINVDEKVGGYADFNLSAEYKIHKNFSIFAHGNNLLNTKYQIFNGYKVLGTQILGGVKITF